MIAPLWAWSFSDFEKIKSELLQKRIVFIEHLQKAQNIKVQYNPPQSPLSLAACEKIRLQVESNYKLSPFHAKYKGGTNYSVFCGNENPRFKVDKIFFDKVNIQTSFFLQAKWQHSFFQKNNNGYGFGGYLLDENFRLLEAFYLQLQNAHDLRNPTHFSIWTLDENGNYYAQTSGLPEGQLTESMQHYLSADLSEQAFHVYQYTHSEQNKPIFKTTYDFKVSLARDWEKAYLIPTHAWTNGFYQYEEASYVREMKNANRLIQLTHGKQICEEIQQIRNFQVVRESHCL